MTSPSASSTNMSFSGNRNQTLIDPFDLSSYSYEHESQGDLAQNWAYTSMVSNIPSFPAEASYLSSFGEYSEESNTILGDPFQSNLNEAPYTGGFVRSTPFHNGGYDVQQEQPLPQQQHTYNSSSLSPSYHHSSSMVARNRNPTIPHSPALSIATSLSLPSSPSHSAWPSPDLHTQDLSLSSSTVSLSHQSTPLDQTMPFITATMIGSEESRRRNRRREQNRKAQFIFRQKRKDEVQRLQHEVSQLKQLLATTSVQEMTTPAPGCAGASGGFGVPMGSCALGTGYPAQCY